MKVRHYNENHFLLHAFMLSSVKYIQKEVMQLSCTISFFIFQVMKIVSFILSLFLLGATFIPCTDLAAVSTGQSLQQLEVQLAQQDHEDAHTNSFDLCTPFCSCHCCHTHVTYNEAALDLKVDNSSTAGYTLYPNYLPISFFSIWQPPKIT
jgi:hypothetical protein